MPSFVSTPNNENSDPTTELLIDLTDQSIAGFSPSLSNSKNPDISNKSTLSNSSSTNFFGDTLATKTIGQFDLNYLLSPMAEPETTKATATENNFDKPIERWLNVNIRAGDSLTKIFKQLGLDTRIALEIARRSDAKILNMLRTGPYLQLLVRGKRLISLRYQPDLLSILSVDLQGETYRVNKIQRQFDVVERTATGIIQSSLLESGIAKGISQSLLFNFASIFQRQIDFNKDVRSGDQYTFIYEERYLEGRKFSSGPILAAELIVRGNMYRAIRHIGKNGANQYFTPEGESLQGLFLRSPMRIARITSPFSKKRYHPVLKKWRAHKGVDYAGRIGDPVMATADGIVTFAGRKHQYGKVVILQHGQKYSTLYAHLSKIPEKIRKNSAVTQGQVIGYVGNTGLTTGPHLHYEFRVNGIHKDPHTVKLPRSFAIDRSLRPIIMKNSDFWSKRLNQLTRR